MEPITVIYDADCGVCQASVGWARKRAARGALRFVGNDEPLPDGVSLDETAHTVVVLDRGRKLVRADAVASILRRLRWWSPVAFILRVPGFRQVANLAYDQFAKRRHRISAALGLAACQVRPAPGKPDSLVKVRAGPEDQSGA